MNNEQFPQNSFYGDFIMWENSIVIQIIAPFIFTQLTDRYLSYVDLWIVALAKACSHEQQQTTNKQQQSFNFYGNEKSINLWCVYHDFSDFNLLNTSL